MRNTLIAPRLCRHRSNSIGRPSLQHLGSSARPNWACTDDLHCARCAAAGRFFQWRFQYSRPGKPSHFSMAALNTSSLGNLSIPEVKRRSAIRRLEYVHVLWKARSLSACTLIRRSPWRASNVLTTSTFPLRHDHWRASYSCLACTLIRRSPSRASRTRTISM